MEIKIRRAKLAERGIGEEKRVVPPFSSPVSTRLASFPEMFSHHSPPRSLAPGYNSMNKNMTRIINYYTEIKFTYQIVIPQSHSTVVA